MKRREISFSPPDISELEIEEVVKALKSGWITTGPRVKELEERLAAYSQVDRAVCLNSATAAEEMNLRILGIGEGDEVLVPAYTYTASASAAIHTGAEVKFIDSQADSLEMDYDALERAIGPKTKAIVTVDLGGIPCDYDRIFEIVEKKRPLFTAKEVDSSKAEPLELQELGARIQRSIGRVMVISDAAHALGARWKGQRLGAVADFSSFSFHAVKNFTTGEGGMSSWKSLPGIDNEEIYHWYQLLSLHGQSKDALHKNRAGAWEYDIIGPFYKCNMTDIMAAIGLRQLDRYPALLERRREIISRYDKACDELGVHHLNHYGDPDRQSSGHLYITQVTGCNDAERREIILKMAENGVAANVHYKPLPMMTAYKQLGWDIQDFPQAYAHYVNEVTLPLHTLLSDEDVDYVIEVFKEAVSEVRGD